VPRLRVRKIARAEVIAAFEWYLARSPVAAEQFLEAVDDAMSRIEEAPDRHPIIRGRLRRVLLRRFPYAVYYKVYRSSISVVGVIHGYRHPDTWLRRAAP
jgi:plasmid stabilization system protein ParE